MKEQGQEPTRAIKMVMEQFDISDLLLIRIISDADLLKCQGMGRKQLVKVRDLYPYHQDTDRLIRRLRPEVKLGSIRGVVAVRTTFRSLIFGTTEGSLKISLGPVVPDFEGFGDINRGDKPRSVLGICSSLRDVRSLTLDDHGVIYGIWGGDMRIETHDFTFVISLLGDGEYDPEDEPPN